MTTHSPTKDLIPAFQRNARSVFAPLQREFNRFFLKLFVPKRPGAVTKTIEIQSK